MGFDKEIFGWIIIVYIICVISDRKIALVSLCHWSDLRLDLRLFFKVLLNLFITLAHVLNFCHQSCFCTYFSDQGCEFKKRSLCTVFKSVPCKRLDILFVAHYRGNIRAVWVLTSVLFLIKVGIEGELGKIGVRSSVERHFFKLPADLIKLRVQLLRRLVQLHELVQGADFELCLVYLRHSRVSGWRALLLTSRSLTCQLSGLGGGVFPIWLCSELHPHSCNLCRRLKQYSTSCLNYSN